MRRSFLLLASVILFSLFVHPARADVVTLKNGDHLTGKVKQMVEGKLTIATTQAGAVTIPIANIRAIETDEPVRLYFKSGEQRKDRMLPAAEGTEGRFVIAERDLRPEFALTDLESINPPQPKWTGSAAANFALSDALFSTQTISGTLNARYQGRGTLITTDAGYLNSHESHVQTDDLAFLNADYSYGAEVQRVGNFRFVNVKLRHDGIQGLDLRALVGVGVGRIQKTARNGFIRGEVGLSYRHEKFTETTNRLLSLQVGYDLDLKLRTGTRIRHDLTYYPAINDIGNNYLLTHVTLEKPIRGSLYLDFRFIFDNTTEVGENASERTQTILLGFGVRF